MAVSTGQNPASFLFSSVRHSAVFPHLRSQEWYNPSTFVLFSVGAGSVVSLNFFVFLFAPQSPSLSLNYISPWYEILKKENSKSQKTVSATIYDNRNNMLDSGTDPRIQIQSAPWERLSRCSVQGRLKGMWWPPAANTRCPRGKLQHNKIIIHHCEECSYL